MNYYQRNVGDWRVATGKLTRVQRDIYSELIDTYYDKEQPLVGDIDQLAEDQACRTVEEREALEYILKRFFKRDGGVWRHERCDEEIAHCYQVIHARSKAGKLSGSARALKRAQRKMNTGGTNGEQKAAEGQLPNTDNRRPLSSPDGELGGESAAKSPPPPPPPPPPAPAPAEQHRKPTKPLNGGSAATPPAPTEKPAVAASRPTRKAPKDFEVTPEMAAWAATECPLLPVQDIERETAKFKDHTFGRAITDWVGAWRNWLRKEQQFRESRGGFVRGPVVNAKEAERQRVLGGLYGSNKENSDAASRSGTIDVESRVVRDSESDDFPPDAGA